MAKKVPSYQTEGVPRRAPQLAPVDAGSLIETLGNFQAQAQSEAIDAASRAASGLGSRQGIEAAQGGAPQPSGREDTAAGQAYTKAARASYMGQLEVDIQEVSEDFSQKWKNGEYGDDFGQWSKGYDAAVQGLSKGMDEDTRSVYGPRLQSIGNRTRSAVQSDFQERTKEKQRAEVINAVDVVTDDLMGFARDGDIFEIEANKASIEAMLSDAVEGRLIDAPAAAELMIDVSDNLSAEAYVGEFQEADDMRAYLDAFKEKRPTDLTPEQHETLAADMESRLTKIETEFSKRDAYAVVDSMGKKGLSYGEGRDYIRDNVENPNTRQNAESLWQQEKTANEQQEAIDYDVHINASYQNIVDGELLPAEIQADPTLTGKDKAALIDYMNKKAKGDDVATNWATYAKLMDMTPAELLEETPLSYRNKLADAEFKQIVGRRTRALEAKASGETDTDEGTTAQALSAAIKEMEWDTKSPRSGKLYRIALEQINSAAAIKGDELDLAEKTEIINNLLTTGTYDVGAFWDSKQTLVEALETPQAANWKVRDVEDVPFVERQAIETVLKERKIAPTDANVLFEYNESLGVK